MCVPREKYFLKDREMIIHSEACPAFSGQVLLHHSHASCLLRMPMQKDSSEKHLNGPFSFFIPQVTKTATLPEKFPAAFKNPVGLPKSLGGLS